MLPREIVPISAVEELIAKALSPMNLCENDLAMWQEIFLGLYADGFWLIKRGEESRVVCHAALTESHLDALARLLLQRASRKIAEREAGHSGN